MLWTFLDRPCTSQLQAYTCSRGRSHGPARRTRWRRAGASATRHREGKDISSKSASSGMRADGSSDELGRWGPEHWKMSSSRQGGGGIFRGELSWSWSTGNCPRSCDSSCGFGIWRLRRRRRKLQAERRWQRHAGMIERIEKIADAKLGLDSGRGRVSACTDDKGQHQRGSNTHRSLPGS